MGNTANAIAAAAKALTFIRYRLVMVFRVDRVLMCLNPEIPVGRVCADPDSKRRAKIFSVIFKLR